MAPTQFAQSLIDRLDATEGRLARLAATAPPSGLTEPDPGGEERWDAGQVWAHIAELVPYWIGQARLMLAWSGDGAVAFGRLPTDGIRVDAIEAGRFQSPADRWRSIQASFAACRAFAAGLGAEAWEVVGRNAGGQPQTVASVLERNVLMHLAQHAAQLEGLAGG